MTWQKSNRGLIDKTSKEDPLCNLQTRIFLGLLANHLTIKSNFDDLLSYQVSVAVLVFDKSQHY
jgi:hypothetical protein